MKKGNTKYLWIGLVFFAAFVLWTVLVGFMDVQPIGPKGSSVGFAALNGPVHEAIGVHWGLYTLTDWLGLVPIGFVLGFAVLGLVQLIRRKSLFKVGRSLLALGGFYVIVLEMYLLFEAAVVNYRPVLIDGNLEAFYPSSTTVLALCVIPTAMMQLMAHIHNRLLRWGVLGLLWAFTAFMVIGRLASSVRWLSDIIGGLLLSVGLVALYAFAVKWQGGAGAASPGSACVCP